MANANLVLEKNTTTGNQQNKDIFFEGRMRTVFFRTVRTVFFKGNFAPRHSTMLIFATGHYSILPLLLDTL